MSKKKRERKITFEKGSIMALAISLIASGSQLIATHNIVEGITLVIIGFALIYLREYLKFHHWASKTFWHNKPIGEERAK